MSYLLWKLLRLTQNTKLTDIDIKEATVSNKQKRPYFTPKD